MKAPQSLETDRLILRQPLPTDAKVIFDRYGGDRDVTRYLGWPQHEAIEQTRSFLAFSDAAWANSPGGPYLIESRDSQTLLGSTGFDFETPFRATVGYVLARDAWGYGYATEALRAIVAMAHKLRIRRLQAHCHPENRASSRVLDKCGFTLEGTLRQYLVFPNLGNAEPSDVLCYSRIFS